MQFNVKYLREGDGKYVGHVHLEGNRENNCSHSINTVVTELEILGRAWSRGDVVPAYTKVDEDWSGEYKGDAPGVSPVLQFRAGEQSIHDRTILWIAE